jgi:putative transposase
MVQRPEDYGSSSYRGNALGAPDVLLTPHDTYRNLGVTDEQRRAAYRMVTIEATVLDEIRTAANAGYALGTEEFHANLAKQTGRRSCPGTNGRPRLNRPPDAGLVGA